LFKDLDLRAAMMVFSVELLIEGHPKLLKGLVMSSPRSLLFKAWARRSGYSVLVVRWLQPHKPHHRIVISVLPNYEGALKGLGKALETAESDKRIQLKQPRPTDKPRWDDVDNNDPWYDGRLPVHNYTIVDSPHEETVLDLDEVVKIVLDSNQWRI
jgi:hypothetical protein